VRSNGHDEPLAAATNLLVARAAFAKCAELYVRKMSDEVEELYFETEDELGSECMAFIRSLESGVRRMAGLPDAADADLVNMPAAGAAPARPVA
jgi:hypothetical protein